MITIGSRTRSSLSEPGFSLGELREEAIRRGIPVKGKRAVDLSGELRVLSSPGTPESLDIPGVLYHRNIAVKSSKNHIVFYDLDSSTKLEESGYMRGVECAGVTSTGKVLYFIRDMDGHIPEFHLASFGEVLGGKSTIVPTPDHWMRIIGVVGMKLVYISDIEEGQHAVATFDLKTYEVGDLFVGRVRRNDFLIKTKEDGFPDQVTEAWLLIGTEEPGSKERGTKYERGSFILFDINTGKKLWEEKEETFGDIGNFYLVNPTTLVVDDQVGETPIFHLNEGKWNKIEFSEMSWFLAAGMSRGRLLLSNGTSITVFDISGLTSFASPSGRDLYHPQEVTDASLRITGELGDSPDALLELPDGRVYYYSSTTNKEFLVDVDFDTVDDVHDSEAEYKPENFKYFLLPPLGERKKFTEVIFDAAEKRIPKAVAAVIEGFI